MPVSCIYERGRERSQAERVNLRLTQRVLGLAQEEVKSIPFSKSGDLWVQNLGKFSTFVQKKIDRGLAGAQREWWAHPPILSHFCAGIVLLPDRY